MKDDSVRRTAQSEQEECGSNLTRTYVGSVCAAVGLLAGMILVSLWLFFSGMGEGLILMFPVAFLGATILVIHSVVTHKKWLQIVAVIILVSTISLVVSMALGLFS